MDERYSNKHRNMVFVKPEISQLIKASTDQDEVEKTIRNLGLRNADWVFFPVNNNETDKEGGSHWSLLLYSGTGRHKPASTASAARSPKLKLLSKK